jgi:hypothetical protein
MKLATMKYLFGAIALFVILPLSTANARRCTGSDPCSAYKKYRYCEHCAVEGAVWRKEPANV